MSLSEEKETTKKKLKNLFKISKHRQSKMPLVISIAILLGGSIGIVICLILKESISLGFTAGGFIGLFIGLLIGGILDLYEKRKQ